MKRSPEDDTEAGGWGVSDEAATGKLEADTVSVRSPALADTEAPASRASTARPPSHESLPNYRLGEMLGRGGMGEVLLATDLEIGRDVAIKRLRGDVTSEALINRFLREARIQALLDHPAIVPVHEIGRDEKGRPFFTMKRVSGLSLGDAIKQRSATVQRMLRAYAEVCLAIGLAHARGFIHRDLKPSNIMLGEYGEVYVIDWGLARALDETDPPRLPELVAPLGGDTAAGVVMGTPGYMSPEQLSGDVVGPATDVYALGAILYEILTRKKAHPGTAAVASTLAGGTISPAAAAPEGTVPPELDRLCIEALSEDARHRPTARQLAERVQQYLDGDRDLEARRNVAHELVITARADLESGELARRGAAIKAAGRALALDPSSEPAAGLVAKLMIEPPAAMPPELVARLDELDEEQSRSHGKRAGLWLAAFFPFFPVAVWMGVRDWRAIGLLYGIVVVAIGLAIVRQRWRSVPGVVGLVLHACMLLAFSRVTSPFLILPTIVLGVATLSVMYPEFLDRPWLVLGINLAAQVLPIVFEAVGWWTSTWEVADGRFIANANALVIDGVPATVCLISITVATAVLIPLFVRSLVIAQRQSRQQLELQAWHLQHLIPKV